MSRPHHKPRFWRLCRIYFRRFRIAVWLVVICLLGALLYLNQVGLPGFVKKPLLEKLRARGVSLEFTRLRVRWYQGIVAENVRFGRSDDPRGPEFTARDVEVRLNAKALARFQVQVDGLLLRQGRLLWPVVDTNGLRRELRVERIQTELLFLPNDQWALNHFTAGFSGARVDLSGTITNASAVRGWSSLGDQAPGPQHSTEWQHRFLVLSDYLERIRFSAPPELRVEVRGDARDLRSFGARLLVAAPGAETPWGTLTEGRFTARIYPADTNRHSKAELTLEAADAQTRWANITNFHLLVHLGSNEGETNLVEADLSLSANNAETRWGSGTNASLTAQWVHSITNPVPLSGRGRLQCGFAQTRWAQGAQLDFSALFKRAPGDDTLCEPSWGWWTNIQPYGLQWEGRLGELSLSGFAAQALACSGSWSAPWLSLSNAEATVGPGRFHTSGELNVASRCVEGHVQSNIDPQSLRPLLPESARRWLAQFTWPAAPSVSGHASAVLPAWTNREPDWRGQVLPTFALDGRFELQNGGSYRGVEVTNASAHFAYSNLCWHLPDIILSRPEGIVRAAHRASDLTKDFYWEIESTFFPGSITPVLGPEVERVLDLFEFTQPPWVSARIWGRSRDPDQTAFEARAALTNFSFRGQALTLLRTDAALTNRVLRFSKPYAERGSQRMAADGLAVDFNAQLIFLTNGVSSAEPMVIARAVGPQVARAIEPFQFLQPPSARVTGTIPMHGEEGADLHFNLEGGPFHWWKFNLPLVKAHVHWAGEQLTLTNVSADFYGGFAEGFAHFNFVPEPQPDLEFSVNITNVALQNLMGELSDSGRPPEGRLNGNLVISHANLGSWETVFGHGSAVLRDGMLWDIPMFGVFSPVLNGISPGLGNSRATEGTASFVLTNGVLRSDDLQIRASGVRLLYRGNLALDSRLNARVEAELLRDVWLVGPLVSTVFWPVTKMFEYKVSGTLGEPKLEPLYVFPKLMMAPFRPIRTLKNLMPESSSSGSTNAPPSPSSR